MVEEDLTNGKEVGGKRSLDREARLHAGGRSQHIVFSNHCI